MTEQDTGKTGAAKPPKKPGALRKVLRWTVLSVCGLLGAAVLIAAAFVVFGIPIDLSGLRGTVESAASEATGRKVRVDGAITLEPAPWPTVRIEGVRVGNPEGWPDADFAQLDRARVQFGVLPLLKGEIRVGEVGVDGVRVRMDVNAEGEPNWLFETPEKQPEPEKEGAGKARALAVVELKALEFRDIVVTYRDAASDKIFKARFDEVTGGAEHLKRLDLAIKGAAQEVPFTVRVTGGGLDTFIESETHWPIEMVTEVAGARLAVAGVVGDPMRGAEIVLDFDFEGPTMKNLEALFGTELPPMRAFDFQGRIEESDGIYRISGLKGEVGGTEFTGGFEADATGARARLRGTLDIQSIDVGPFYSALDKLEDEQTETAPEPAGDTVAPQDVMDLDEPIVVLDPLRNFDAEFSLKVHRVTNSRLGLRDASLKVVIADGGLTAPMAITVAEVPFQGKISVAPDNDSPKVAVSLWAEKTDIGELARLLLSAEGVEGGFENAEVAFVTQGQTIRALAEAAELRFAMTGASLSYGNEADGRPVEFTLESADMIVPGLDRAKFAATGTLLGGPFAVEATGGTFLDSYIDREWPIELAATGGGARLRVAGTVVEAKHGAGTNLKFDLTGKRIGGLATWIGVSPEARSRYNLVGSVGITDTETRVRIKDARIGNTALSGNVGRREEGGEFVSFVDLKASLIDVQELAGMAPVAPEQPRQQARQQSQETDRQGLAIDVPIMPQGIEIFDTDIDVAIQQIKLGPADVTGVSLSTKIRDGHVAGAPFRATVAGAVLAGDIAADLRGDVPAIDFGLRSENVNVGTLLEQLGVVEGLDLTAGRFDLKVAMRGASAREILERSEFSAGIRNGLWKLQDPNMEGSLDIGLPKGNINAERGKPITLSLDGRLEATPVKITLITDPLASFARRKDRLRMDLTMAMLGTNLHLAGAAPMPVHADDLHFTMDFRGKSFSDLDGLLDVLLPPIGPYRLTGEFGTRASGYYIDNLALTVGESTLNGKLDFRTTLHPPRLTVDLVANTIQLDDFDTGDWSPLAEDEAPETAETSRKNVDQTVEEIRAVLSPEVMRVMDARVTLSVRQVLSGRDRLGNGSMIATLQDGRARVDPLTLNVPGGSVDLGFALEPTETDVGLEARARIERLDYGILARRIDPASDLGGIISADVDIETRGQSLDNVMNASNGHIDFAVWPRNLEADLFDLWAVNLFVAMMPSLDSETRSRVNCIVARFRLQDGIMRPSALLIDSTNIQASGDGVIDFKADTVEFMAAPRPKRPQMFSAQTPVQVSGSIPEIKVGLASGAVLGTIIRMVTSPVVVPLQWIFTEVEPADGKIACQRAWSHSSP